MDIMFIVFMIFAGVVSAAVFALVVIEFASDIKAKRRAALAKTEAPVAPQSIPMPTVEEPPFEKPPIAVEETPTVAPQEDADGGVWIAVKQSQSLSEKYAALSEEQRAWYDSIKDYAMSKDGVKNCRYERYEECKIGIYRIVRLVIKRGVLQCEFVFLNPDFSHYINENKVQVKTAPTVIRIDSNEAAETARTSVDIAVKAVETDRQYKKERQLEKRRQARAARKNHAQNAASLQEVTNE